MSSRRPRLIVSVLACGALALALAGCSSGGKQPAAEKTVTPSGPVVLTFAVYGPPQVITAYTKIAADYRDKHPETVVNIRPYDTHAEAVAGLAKSEAQGNPPDIFLADQRDLPTLMQDNDIQRVDELLGDRNVDFGDLYQRDGIEGFSADSALQCMPSEVSPMVVYYNPSMINVSTLAGPGQPPVTAKSWTLAEFKHAAALASKGHNRGLYVAPDLAQVAPFIWSGGGDIVDDPTKPTTLTLAAGKSESSLEQLLEIVRNPAYTFSRAELAKSSALQRFEAGHLAMMLGFRDLTPQLRAQQSLTFDVMPLPTVGGSSATTTEMTGLCLSKQTHNTSTAADFLAYLVSDGAQQTLAETGFVMPANTDVLNSAAFLQPDQQPLNASVFAASVRNSRLLPNGSTWPSVEAAAARWLTQLFYQPVIDPLDARLKAYDTASEQLFNPSAPTPTSTPTD